MPTGLEVAKAAIDDFKKFKNICYWQKKKMPQKHMQN